VNSFRKSTLIALFVSTLCAVLSAGCNTTKGLGKDVERAGEKIQENASR
jgi:predicted small secreted protein